jgi:glycine betaine/proline transport system ATP-binding protein
VPHIEIEGLAKVFGPDPASVLPLLAEGVPKDEILARTGHVVGLQDVDITVERGETFVVMGLSGSGKSTLVRCLNRLIEPTAGALRLGGVDVLALGPRDLRELRRHRIGMVFQRFALLPHRTVVDNVAFGLQIQGVKPSERHARARTWIETVGLGGYEDARPSELSGGMQQRVGLARALCTDPDVLLMDEAFSALDPLIRREMQGELVRLQQELHKTIVFITHDLDEALRLGDRIAILKAGRVVQIGTPVDIVTKPADAYVKAFVEDVNRARVLKVKHVIHQPIEASLRDLAGDVAARLTAAESQAAFVVDDARRFQGVVTGWEAGDTSPTTPAVDLLREQTLTLDADTMLEDAMEPLGDSPLPVAVLDAAGRLLGVVRPRDALRAMARHRLEDRVGDHGTGPEAPAAREVPDPNDRVADRSP